MEVRVIRDGDIGIYIIKNITTGKIYVGSSAYISQRKSCHFGKLKRGIHPNKLLQNSFDKHGVDNFRFEILELIEFSEDKNIIKEKLIEREQFWLDKYMSYKKENGYNIRTVADSNLGVSGGPLSEEHKQKISKSNIGKKHSPESIRKGVLSRAGTIDKPVINITTNKIFNSIKEASEFYNIDRAGISHTCLGNNSESGGYKWAYISKDGKIIEPKFISRDTRKRIINIDTGEVFDSIMQASKFYNINRSNINQCCIGTVGMAGGYSWAYIDSENNILYSKYKNKTKRSVINVDTNIIYSSIKEASRDTNIYRDCISNNVTGKSKSAGCFHWMYYEDYLKQQDIDNKDN